MAFYMGLPGVKRKNYLQQGIISPYLQLVFGGRILISGEHELTIGAGIAIPESPIFANLKGWTLITKSIL